MPTAPQTAAMACRRFFKIHRLGDRAQQIFAQRTFNAFTKSPRAQKALTKAFGHLCTPMAKAKKNIRLTPKAVVDDVIEMYELTVKQAAMGQLTHDSFSMLATAWKVAGVIESEGEVRGLAGELAAFDAALKSIYSRCMVKTAGKGVWTPCACRADELEALRGFVATHRFQLSNILHASLIRIGNKLEQEERAKGDVDVMDVQAELQHMRIATQGYEMDFPRLVAA